MPDNNFDELLLDIQMEKAREEQEHLDRVRYTGFQAILKAALGDYADMGFWLKEIADHAIELYFKDKCIAVYNQTALTIPMLHEGCRNFLKNTAGY